MVRVADALCRWFVEWAERLDEAVLEPLSDDRLTQDSDRDQEIQNNQKRGAIVVNTAKPAEPRKKPEENS